MEKKQYIMPSVRVKAVNMLLMQNTSPSGTLDGTPTFGTNPDEEDADGAAAKGFDGSHDVRED